MLLLLFDTIILAWCLTKATWY